MLTGFIYLIHIYTGLVLIRINAKLTVTPNTTSSSTCARYEHYIVCDIMLWCILCVTSCSGAVIITHVAFVPLGPQSILTRSRSSCFESASYAKDACFDACNPTFRRRLQSVDDIKRRFKEGFEQALAHATAPTLRNKRAKKYYFW